jgi:hypothetical protein
MMDAVRLAMDVHAPPERAFARHGEGADAYRAGMGSPRGWPLILKRFAAAAKR